jgi:hypothetical protein
VKRKFKCKDLAALLAPNSRAKVANMTDWILNKIAEPSSFLAIAFVCILGAAIGAYEKDKIREWAFGAFALFCIGVAAILHKLS